MCWFIWFLSRDNEVEQPRVKARDEPYRVPFPDLYAMDVNTSLLQIRACGVVERH